LGFSDRACRGLDGEREARCGARRSLKARSAAEDGRDRLSCLARNGRKPRGRKPEDRRCAARRTSTPYATRDRAGRPAPRGQDHPAIPRPAETAAATHTPNRSLPATAPSAAPAV